MTTYMREYFIAKIEYFTKRAYEYNFEYVHHPFSIVKTREAVFYIKGE